MFTIFDFQIMCNDFIEKCAGFTKSNNFERTLTKSFTPLSIAGGGCGFRYSCSGLGFVYL